MRNAALHRLLEDFTIDASRRLSGLAAQGAEVPFEVTEERGAGRVPLYCYRPLTSAFIRSGMASLTALSSHGPAAQAVGALDSVEAYLSEHGATGRIPSDRRASAEAALGVFLESVFRERTEFGFEPAHFEAAYGDLERALYEGRCTATVVAPILGVALDPATIELSLGDGVSLIRGDALADAPAEAVWGDAEEPNVLALLAVDQDRANRPPVAVARARFRRILSALRLFERGGYALGPVAWTRTGAGGWRWAPVGAGGRPRRLSLIRTADEEELRAFYRLVSRRAPGAGELAWALARFEMGCERVVASEALSDYLLALRALLEPEGPASGRLAQRLAVICARPEERAALAARTARAISLERALITGVDTAGDDPTHPDALVDELAEHLRAILRDALCGHLDADLRCVADDLLAEAAGVAGGDP